MSRWHMVAFLLLTAGLTVAVAWHPAPDTPSSCTMKILTGIGCPGCGLTRAVTSAAHGDLTQSIRWHLFGIPILALGLAGWAGIGAGLLTGTDYLARLNTRATTITAVSTLSGMLAYWVIRLITHTAP